jgi:hypothetical protein
MPRNTRKIIPRGIVSNKRSLASKARYTRKKLRLNQNFSNRHNGALRFLEPSPRSRTNSRFNLERIHPSEFYNSSEPIRFDRAIERGSYRHIIDPHIYVSNQQFADNRLQSHRTQKNINNLRKNLNIKYNLRHLEPVTLSLQSPPPKPPRLLINNGSVFNPLHRG